MESTTEGQAEAPDSGMSEYDRANAEQKLKAAITAEITDAVGWMGSRLAEDRRTALEYYLGAPFGNEQEGRSQIVLRDVLDTIEWVMPSLLRIFTSGDEVVQFTPTGQEDEGVAEQATAYCNWIMMRDNPGFLILYQLFKDALLERFGAGKAYWNEECYEEGSLYLGMNDDEFMMLLKDPDVEVLQHTDVPLPAPPPEPVQTPQGMVVPPAQPSPGSVHDALIRRCRNRVKIENIPPEEFLMSRDARSLNDARYLGHRARKTASDLVEMGIPKEVVDGLPEGGFADEFNMERIARNSLDDAFGGVLTQPSGAARIIWTTESYIRHDWDGDGITELRYVLSVGTDAQTLLKNEQVDDHPFFGLTPVIIPHKVIGLSLADLVMQFQLLRSTLVRQFLDNLYFTTNGRWGVIEGKVNLDDVLNNIPGGVVRMEMEGAVFPLAPPPIGQVVLPMMEFLAGERENASGVTRYNQGSDANSLNKTAHGISQIMSASQARVELIARIFAETGVKALFQKILRLIVKHQNKPRVIRLTNKWVPMDPSEWSSQMDVTINVGIGSGSRETIAANSAAIIAMQEKVGMSPFGPQLLTAENVYKSLKSFVQNTGFKGDGGYFTDPTDSKPPPPKPDVALLELEQKGHLETAKLALERDKMLLENHAAMAKLYLDNGQPPPPMPMLSSAGPGVPSPNMNGGQVAEGDAQAPPMPMRGAPPPGAPPNFNPMGAQ